MGESLSILVIGFFPLQQISPAQAVSHLAEARPEGRLVDTRKQLGGGNVM